MVETSRRIHSVVSSLAKDPKFADAAKDLKDSLGFVMPPSGERAIIDSLKGQSKKQRIARPDPKLQQLLRYINHATAKQYPTALWSYSSIPVGKILNYYIEVAEDKSIGWSALLFPGTRGNIQKDMNKRRKIINLTKFCLALRFAWAKHLHTLAPHELVQLGMRDPCVAFIKREGHPRGRRTQRRGGSSGSWASSIDSSMPRYLPSKTRAISPRTNARPHNPI